MRKITVLLIACFCLAVYSCESNSLSSPTGQLLPKGADLLDITEPPTDDHVNLLYYCANNFYADKLTQSTWTFTYAECDTSGDEYIYGDDCAYLWAEYNPSWDDDLTHKACGEDIPTSLPAISNFTKESGSYPTMSWDFMWAHYYVIERKIGTGSYSTVYTYTVPNEPMQSAPDTNWVDTSILLRRFEDKVTYRIKGKVWSEYSSTAPTIYWDNRPDPDSNED